MKNSYDDVVVDLLKIDRFTEEHLEIIKEIHKNHWIKFYPELYGDGLPEEIEFDGFYLIESDQKSKKEGTQPFRIGGRTVKDQFKSIKQNIERNGFKLKYPPISWMRFHSGPNGYETITGNTRGEILAAQPFNIKNRIVAVYKAKSGYSEDEVRDAFESLGGRFNTIHDPAAPLSPADCAHIVTLSCQRYIDTKGKAGTPMTLDAITEKVDYVCGEGVFAPSTRMKIIFGIYNNFHSENLVITWGTDESSEFRISTFLQSIKWIDTEKIKYICMNYDTPSKIFRAAVKKLRAFPYAEEVRIVLNTGTLSASGGSYNLSETYKNRLRKFIREWDQLMYDIDYASDSGSSFSKIKVYGALPALGSSHDLELPFRVNESKRAFYQSGGCCITFEKEDENEDELFEEDSSSLDLTLV